MCDDVPAFTDASVTFVIGIVKKFFMMIGFSGAPPPCLNWCIHLLAGFTASIWISSHCCREGAWQSVHLFKSGIILILTYCMCTSLCLLTGSSQVVMQSTGDRAARMGS